MGMTNHPCMAHCAQDGWLILKAFLFEGRNSGRAGEIRTHDLLHPMQAFYQAELRPDLLAGQREAVRLGRRIMAGTTLIATDLFSMLKIYLRLRMIVVGKPSGRLLADKLIFWAWHSIKFSFGGWPRSIQVTPVGDVLGYRRLGLSMQERNDVSSQRAASLAC
jgi:hypothetical protein